MVAVVVLPCALIVGAEMVLRVFGVGYNPRFFSRVKKPDGVYCVDNPLFGRRFFSSSLVRVSNKLRFPLRKGDNTRRIFILGSSAAQGDPATMFAFSRHLDVLLKKRYKSTRCEVINAAVTATNSHIVVPIARECSTLSPDIFIVYAGNNEVIGPFGPGTIFAQLSGRWFIRLRIFLSSTKLGQLSSGVSELFTKKSGIPEEWGGMKMFMKHKFRYDDQRLEGVYYNYRENLREICRIARKRGARVVLCTVASNLLDCGPFFSMHRPDLPANVRESWNKNYREAVKLQKLGQYDMAHTRYMRAAELDSTYADLRYRLGQCCMPLGKYDEARKHFIAARDYDALRFRADSRINNIVKEVAHEFSGCAVVLDVEERLGAASGEGMCGEKQFLEHVHFNFHGNYLLAASTIPLLDSLLALPRAQTEVISESACRELCAFTPWEELWIGREVKSRLSKAPFTNQEDNLRRADAIEKELHRLTLLVDDSGQSIAAQYRRAASLAPDDWRINNQFGKYLLLKGNDPASAEQEFRTVLGAMPHDASARNDLAIALERQEKTEAAIACYRETIEKYPRTVDAYIGLADNLMMLKRVDEAEQHLRQALRISPENLFVQERLVQVLFIRGKVATAEHYVHKNIISPKVLAACYSKDGMRLEESGDIEAATRQLRRAIEISPELVDAQRSLGRVLVRSGRSDEGLQHLRIAVRLDSTRADIRTDLAGVLATLGLTGEAEKEYRAALLLNSKMVPALTGLGRLLTSTGDVSQAIDLFVLAIKEQPSVLTGHKNLIDACTFIGQKERAIDLLVGVSNDNPQIAEIHYSIGALLLEQGDAAEALRRLQIAATLRPGQREIELLISEANSRLAAEKP